MTKNRVSNLSTIVLWSSIGALLTFVISVGEWKPWLESPRERVPELILPAIELLILAVSGGLSTSFFYITHYNLRKTLGVEDEDINFILWGGIRNIVLFVVAVYSVELTEPFLFVVLLIYVNFCRVNGKQLVLLLDDDRFANDESKSKGRFQSTVDTMIWLREENGIAVLALTSVSLMILVLTLFHVGVGHEIHPASIAEKSDFHLQMKAFIVGAAILHVVSSMIKYFYKFLKEDVVEQAFAQISANDQLSIGHGNAENSTRSEEMIWTLSPETNAAFNRSRYRWRWLIVVCTLTAMLFCGTSFWLTVSRHSKLAYDVPAILTP